MFEDVVEASILRGSNNSLKFDTSSIIVVEASVLRGSNNKEDLGDCIS